MRPLFGGDQDRDPQAPVRTRNAVFSPDRAYRYQLSRIWAPALPPLLWLMLNPSVADEQQDDPTIRRVIGFSRRWRAGGAVIVNLFGACATDPAVLRTLADPVGPENDRYITRYTGSVVLHGVICAWGAHPLAAQRWPVVRQAILRSGWRGFLCLGTTRDGSPKHPLYLGAETPYQLFDIRGENHGRTAEDESGGPDGRRGGGDSDHLCAGAVHRHLERQADHPGRLAERQE